MRKGSILVLLLAALTTPAMAGARTCEDHETRQRDLLEGAVARCESRLLKRGCSTEVCDESDEPDLEAPSPADCVTSCSLVEGACFTGCASVCIHKHVSDPDGLACALCNDVCEVSFPVCLGICARSSEPAQDP